MLEDLVLQGDSAPALLLQEEAFRLPQSRPLTRRFLIFAAARGFAPEACREAVRLWEAAPPSAHTTRQLTYWRGICEFLGDQVRCSHNNVPTDRVPSRRRIP